MKDLTNRQLRFIYKKVFPMLEDLDSNDDTITFDEKSFTPQRVRTLLENIVDQGRYNEKDKRFLTGLAKLYEHLQ